MKSTQTWQILLGVALLLFGVYVAIPYGTFASAIYVAASVFAATAVVFAVRHRAPFYPAAWLLLAYGLALCAIGHAIWYWLDLYGLEPFPSLADAFYLAAYPLFAASLWLLGGQNTRDDGALSDALIVGISATVLSWALLIAPYVYDPGLTLLQLLISAAYPVADLILLPLVLRLVFLHRTRLTAHRLLLVGWFAYFAADLLYAHGNSVGWYAPGGLTDGLWLIAYALFIAAAWHPSAAVEPDSRASRAELSGRRLLILGAASVLVPAVILVTAGTQFEIVRVAAIASILLFLLVMHRMAGLLRETHRQAEVLEGLSQIDPLTGAVNRRQLDYELKRELSRAVRRQTDLSIAFIDLDHFKQFNDTYGHQAGDSLLKEIVAVWHGVLRPTDVVARIGGEEFLVLFPDTNSNQAQIVSERLRNLMPHGQTFSAGLATLQPDESAENFIARADNAMYQAKSRGRNRVVFAVP
ncbi:GGDEF domain-containing protein [Thiohalophilus thiocyanatoxydans]|uniref:diguanylate cyclase n=1 Tax=Thiohalophilus thiocyanatoxydans TaxID=381308 RepID=A0A4R8J0R2_9GAMM|nr:GGDEF domain-containing protein [Thiohalophilus thiocyanatoxydans]TDY03749.1 diguanylate cyclase (GGDEF)-like protein [Thiohalophilus thiocyanatoxydans]